MVVKSRNTTRRLLAIAAIVVVLSFSFLVVAHSHNGPYEDQQCRLCHFAHSTAINLSQGASLPAPSIALRAAQIVSIDPQIQIVSHQLSPRAPPTQLFS